MNLELSTFAQQYLDGCITVLEFRNLIITELCKIEDENELTTLAQAISSHTAE